MRSANDRCRSQRNAARYLRNLRILSKLVGGRKAVESPGLSARPTRIIAPSLVSGLF